MAGQRRGRVEACPWTGFSSAEPSRTRRIALSRARRCPISRKGFLWPRAANNVPNSSWSYSRVQAAAFLATDALIWYRRRSPQGLAGKPDRRRQRSLCKEGKAGLAFKQYSVPRLAELREFRHPFDVLACCHPSHDPYSVIICSADGTPIRSK